jgi:hypothetical protein
MSLNYKLLQRLDSLLVTDMSAAGAVFEGLCAVPAVIMLGRRAKSKGGGACCRASACLVLIHVSSRADYVLLLTS